MGLPRRIVRWLYSQPAPEDKPRRPDPADRGLLSLAVMMGRRRVQLDGQNCTVTLTDVVGFGSDNRTDRDRLIIRESLFKMTRAAAQGIPGVWSEDRGDGILMVAPPNVSTAKFLDRLLQELPAALDQHNCRERKSAQFQLRLAVNVGPVVSDTMGVSGEAIIVAARLVEAPDFKQALVRSTAELGVIVSPFVSRDLMSSLANTLRRCTPRCGSPWPAK